MSARSPLCSRATSSADWSCCRSSRCWAKVAARIRSKRPRSAAKPRKTLVIGGMCCGTALCAGSITQQFALLYTPVGKAGFLTACYILIVPLLGLLFGPQMRCEALVRRCAGDGRAVLPVHDGRQLRLRDGRPHRPVVCAAVLHPYHSHRPFFTDGGRREDVLHPVFLLCDLIGHRYAIFEQPSFANILAAWKPILYAGAMSSGVGYTLQIVGQKGMNPAVASLIMSLESVISVIAGWLILGQALSGREIFGCVLMFGAIVLAQLPERKKQSV